MKTEQKFDKIDYGDFVILGKMLGINPDAARMRYRRGKEDAVEAMNKLQKMKEELISDNQTETDHGD